MASCALVLISLLSSKAAFSLTSLKVVFCNIIWSGDTGTCHSQFRKLEQGHGHVWSNIGWPNINSEFI